MKLVHNNGAWQNSHAQRAALPDTIYSCLASNYTPSAVSSVHVGVRGLSFSLASNGMKYISNFWKYPPRVRKYPNPLYHIVFKS